CVRAGGLWGYNSLDVW
nr:immunoglobulin heavy chain junction region [Macaca mulatta]MOX38547.1 immunoglobulin heavy chain junction region [Macaca mulatta]MOX38645.1 immunoglobulin heavy chain junction region [Macaca mulatta]MOX39442.1 immunoglobulin heavy chain junction region [Macaca mulatta]MOX39625.1 immunoglobulin heavy chain junction region [Macaca mulatta]